MNLQNNSSEMKTVVETFVIEETAELIYDNEQLDKWNELVSELGLQGQTKIVSPEKSPIPFMHLKTSLINVLSCLCPRKVKVEEYDVTPIPVEILDLVALSKRENYFNRVEIWYDEKSPDPVCVGISGYYYQPSWVGDRNKELDGKEFSTEKECKEAGATASIYFSEKNRYLIGKWADVKRSFDELKEMATKRFIAEKGNDFRKQIKEAQRGLDDLEVAAFDQFN
jgi:hypothetical protein